MGDSRKLIAAITAGCALTLLLAADLPDKDKDEKFIGARRNYWAFRKPVRPDVPSIGGAWARNPIDAFILAKLYGRETASTSGTVLVSTVISFATLSVLLGWVALAAWR